MIIKDKKELEEYNKQAAADLIIQALFMKGKNGNIGNYEKNIMIYLLTNGERKEDLLDKATDALNYVHMNVEDLDREECPEGEDQEEWKQMMERYFNLKERIRIRHLLVKAGIYPYLSLINKMQELNHIKGRFLNLREIKELFMSQGDKLAEEIVKGIRKEKGHQRQDYSPER